MNKGGDSTLSWAVTGQTTEINIAPGIGTIEAKGTRRVFPSNTTVYTLTATGPGGTDTRDVTVNVSQPAATPPVQATTPDDGIRTLSDLVNRDVQDVYFDYDKYDIRETRGRPSHATRTCSSRHSAGLEQERSWWRATRTNVGRLSTISGLRTAALRRRGSSLCNSASTQIV